MGSDDRSNTAVNITSEQFSELMNDVKKIGIIEQKIGAIEQKIGAIEQKIGAIEQKIDYNYGTLERKIENLDDQYSSLNRKMKIIETASDYSSGQTRVPEFEPEPIMNSIVDYDYGFVPSKKTSWDEPW